ncbi:unnamed protein product [Cylindrotheca closterium]|uniref:Uncharacterized protein n=1 Tax=Cylindrotheca closterium TaxID=2856 RepID=A0AAD2CU06_9STRA|nr:unnamed protein product [Cylindrotheca closterium]
MTPVTPLDEVIAKAECIKFVAGKYKGKQGWLDHTRTADASTTPVIVNLPKKGGLYGTFVHTGSFRKISTDQPMTYAEAVFQVPAIEASIVEAMRKLAKYDISKDEEEFKKQLDKEMMAAKDWMEQKGDDADWRRVKSWEERNGAVHSA